MSSNRPTMPRFQQVSVSADLSQKKGRGLNPSPFRLGSSDDQLHLETHTRAERAAHAVIKTGVSLTGVKSGAARPRD